MKGTTAALFLGAIVVMAGISGINAQSASAGASAGAVQPKTYNVSLTAGTEVPPVEANSPPSSGYALINFYGNQNPTYAVYVNNGIEVTQAHIHKGPAGQSGPVIFWLYPPGEKTPAKPATGAVTNGVLAQGTITPDQFVGPYVGKTIADLYQDAAQNALYVNVHNTQNPTGFIRGQF